MMEELLSKLEHVCRLCDKSDSKMYNIFEKSEDGHQIIHLITECLPLIIYRKDPLSKHICSSCYTNVLKFSAFRKITLDTFQRHKKGLEDLKSPNNSVTMYLKSATLDDVEDDDLEDMDTSQTLFNGFSEGDLQTDDTSSFAMNYEQNIFDPLTESDKDEPPEITFNVPTVEIMEPLTSAVSSAVTENCESPPRKKRRLIGPKSEMLKFELRGHKRIGPKSEMLKYNEKHSIRPKIVDTPPPVYIYEPISLLNCALNTINSLMNPDYAPECFSKSECTLQCCVYCGITVDSKSALAEHQMEHLYVVIGPKVNEEVNNTNQTLKIQKAWSQSDQTSEETFEGTEEETLPDNDEDTEGSYENEDQNLLVPVDASDEPLPEHDICIINGVPSVNGLPLADYPKEKRRKFYRNIIHNGIKRKFCNLCRYTFKDSWAIECHYFSNSCYYTCRFCGARFTKAKNMFADHLKTHKGEVPSLQIFGQVRKTQKANPYVKRRTLSMAPKVKPINVKKLMMKKQQEIKDSLKPTIKIEPITDYPQEKQSTKAASKPSSTPAGSKPYQAYFCRKCFKVFYKLDEFNIHVQGCTSTNGVGAAQPRTVSKPSEQPRPKAKPPATPEDRGPPVLENQLSNSGRPLRSCARAVRKYMDEPVLEPEWVEEDTPKSKVKTEIGFACEFCSSSFPTMQSRNSHMRIHKKQPHVTKPLPHNNVPAVLPQSHGIARKRPENMAKKAVQVLTVGSGARPLSQQTRPHAPAAAANSNISNIMKLVQNNPNLTIKSMGSMKAENARKQTQPSTSQPSLPPSIPKGSHIPSRGRPTAAKAKAAGIPPPLIVSPPGPPSVASPPGSGDNKNYRCSGCHKPFANKSNLYFHKKNYCTGSRFPCPLCKKRFGSEEAYNSHLYYSHPE